MARRKLGEGVVMVPDLSATMAHLANKIGKLPNNVRNALTKVDEAVALIETADELDLYNDLMRACRESGRQLTKWADTLSLRRLRP